ncbi:hypothetical protein Tco_0558856 [Tanacetum coccineum]
MHEDFIATVYPHVHESLKLTTEEQVYMENPLSSSGTLSSMKNRDDAFTFSDQFLNAKSPEDELRKANVETKAESMVTVPIHQASSSAPPLSTPVIDPSPLKPTIDLELANRVSALEKISANFIKKNKLQDQTTQALSSRAYTLENHDLSHLEHTTLYEALEASMDRENKEEFNEEMAKSRKSHRDDQDPPPPPSKYSNQSKKKRHDSDTSALKKPLP